MPALESIKSDRRLDAEGKEAHLIRTKNRIQSLQTKVRSLDPNVSRAPGRISLESETDLILWELGLLERQLTEPVTKRELLADRDNPLKPRPEFTNLEEIKSQVKEQEGSRQTAANDELIQGLALMVKGLREELAVMKANAVSPATPKA
jgi:hypothetical protein